MWRFSLNMYLRQSYKGLHLPDWLNLNHVTYMLRTTYGRSWLVGFSRIFSILLITWLTCYVQPRWLARFRHPRQTIPNIAPVSLSTILVLNIPDVKLSWRQNTKATPCVDVKCEIAIYINTLNMNKADCVDKLVESLIYIYQFIIFVWCHIVSVYVCVYQVQQSYPLS